MSKVLTEERILLPQSDEHNEEIDENDEENNRNNQNNQLQTYDGGNPLSDIHLTVSSSKAFCYGMGAGYFSQVIYRIVVNSIPFPGMLFVGGSMFYMLMYLQHNNFVEINTKEIEKYIKKLFPTDGNENVYISCMIYFYSCLKYYTDLLTII